MPEKYHRKNKEFNENQKSAQKYSTNKKNNNNLSTVASYSGFNVTHTFGITTLTSFKGQPINVIKSKKKKNKKSINKSQKQNNAKKKEKKQPSLHKKQILSKSKTRATLTQHKHKSLHKANKTHKSLGKTHLLRKKNKSSKNQAKQQNSKQVQQRIQQLTDRKKHHLEFFLYKNKEIPIQNTQQRKFALKIKFIDQKSICLSHRNQNRVEITQKSKQVKNIPNLALNEHILNDSQQKQKITTNKAIQTENQKIQQKGCQTVQISYGIKSQKCFMEALSELQFLYLPDQSNFIGFTQDQRIHYQQLLTFIAKKLQTSPSQNEQIDDQSIQYLIQSRQSQQKGITNKFVDAGIPTHSPSIVSYLSNFFCYLQIQEKTSLVARLNSSYGYSLKQKLTLLRKGMTTRRHYRLISQGTFWGFQQQLHEGLDFQDQNIEQYLHYHNRAIFDCVNQFIEEYQPYYQSNGQPFPWACNLETTFYCIDQDSFGALGCQIKQKIWKCSQILGGIIIQPTNNKKNECKQVVKHKKHIQKILQNQTKMVNSEIKKCSDKIQIDEQRTILLLEVSELIKQYLFYEISSELQNFMQNSIS